MYITLIQTDIIYSLHITRKYFKSIKDKIDDFTRYKYRLRRKILNLGKDNALISIKHISFGNHKIKDILADQFIKIKNYYIE
jgi:hypothetical protein